MTVALTIQRGLALLPSRVSPMNVVRAVMGRANTLSAGAAVMRCHRHSDSATWEAAEAEMSPLSATIEAPQCR